MKGRVILIGAGPADPDLITLRGAAVLAKTKVVLFDELASEELLSLAPQSAERMHSGLKILTFTSPSTVRNFVPDRPQTRMILGVQGVRLPAC